MWIVNPVREWHFKADRVNDFILREHTTILQREKKEFFYTVNISNASVSLGMQFTKDI